jgi:hypothetical protein
MIRRSRSDTPYLVMGITGSLTKANLVAGMPRCDLLLTSVQKIALCCGSKRLAFLTEAGSRQATLRSIPLSTHIL